MTNGFRALAIVAAIGMPLTALSTLRTAQSDSSGSAASFARDLWKHYAELAHTFGASPTRDLGPGSQLQTLVNRCSTDPLLAARIEGGMTKRFRRMQLLHSLTAHPARLEFARKGGSLVGTLGRTWIHPAPFDSSQVELVFKKTGGRGKAEVSFNAFSADGGSRRLWSFTVEPGDETTGRVFRRTFSGVRNAILAAVVDGKSIAREISYEVHIRRPGQGEILQPAVNTLGPVSGFADLHAHQMAEHAFAGQWLFGSTMDPLRPCTGTNHGKLPFTQTPWRGDHRDRTRPGIDWPLHLDSMHQMMHADHIKQAVDGGLRLLVVSVVNNMWLAHATEPDTPSPVPLNDMDNIRLQIKAVHAFARKFPWYRVARDPWEARRIIHEGKLAVVIAVEVSHLMPATHGEWVDQLDELYGMGVRCLEIAHETDSRFAGAAHHHGAGFSVMRALKSLGQARFGRMVDDFFVLYPDGPKLPLTPGFTGFNTVGLLPEGRQLLREMARRKMLFEIDHCSRKARSDIHQFFTGAAAPPEVRNYPYFYSHARFDELMPPRQWIESNFGKAPYSHAEGFDSREDTGEYMPTQQEVSRMQSVGGVFGIRTGANAQLPFKGCPVENRVHTSSRSLAQIIAMGKSMGLAMALGTDMQGFVPLTGARFQGTQKHAIVASGLPGQKPDNPATDKPVGNGSGGLGEFDVFGLRHAGLTPDLLKDLENLGLPIPEIRNSAESFLKMWQRCYQPSRPLLNRDQYRALMGIP